MLTDRLDHHRGRGQQQIVVKHVTVNADQAMVAETITTAPALQANSQAALHQFFSRSWSRVAGGRTREPLRSSEGGQVGSHCRFTEPPLISRFHPFFRHPKSRNRQLCPRYFA